MHIQPLILCGGSGSRMWPLSREQYPKQLLCLGGQVSMLQATVQRLGGMALPAGAAVAPPILVGNDEYRFLMAEQLRQIGVAHGGMLLEPCGRNTAPALTLGALLAQAGGQDPLLVVMPADHVIQDETAFAAAVLQALAVAARGLLVTFGIVPTAPETGYGYIAVGEPLAEQGASQVAQFVEKPDLATAQAYVSSGRYWWNSGIFVMRASVWLAKMAQLQPAMLAACQQAFDGRAQDLDFVRPNKAAFEACPAESIDYAVMEPLTAPGHNQGEVAVVPLAAQWSDVGAWSALWDISPKDEAGNVFKGDVLGLGTSGSLVLSSGRLVATVGLKDVVVVETPDAVLVADRHQIQQVKAVVAQLKAAGRSETNAHRKVHRPWGWYDSIDAGPRFQVKRIVVKPGGVLSLQMHHHRAEHWIVVSGTAKVTKGDSSFLVTENESTYIPLGTTHRLENPGKLPLEMIEVQSGSYLGEDDIVRFEDVYGR